MKDNFDAILLSSEQYNIHGDENDSTEEKNECDDERLELSLSLAGVSLLSESHNCGLTFILGVQLVATILCGISNEGSSTKGGTTSVEASSTQDCKSTYMS